MFGLVAYNTKTCLKRLDKNHDFLNALVLLFRVIKFPLKCAQIEISC